MERDAVLVNSEVMGDQHGFELANQSATTRASAESPNVMSNSHNTSCRLSFSKLEVALMIAVAIFAILSTVFIAMYFTTDGNACRCQNSPKNKGNESKNSPKNKGNESMNYSTTVECSANKTTPNNSETDCKALKLDIVAKNLLYRTQCFGPCQAMLFHRKSTADYAISRGAGDMTAITACFWVKSNQTKGNIHYISYGVTDNTRSSDAAANEFYVSSYINRLRFVVKNTANDVIRGANISINDGKWHAICCVWLSQNGQSRIYKDGKLVLHIYGYHQNQNILGGGTWVVGHDQDSVGGGFDTDQMFLGEITDVNIWDKELSFAEIAKFSKSCQCKLRGKVKSWNNFTAAVKGDVRIVKNPTCHKV